VLVLRCVRGDGCCRPRNSGPPSFHGSRRGRSTSRYPEPGISSRRRFFEHALDAIEALVSLHRTWDSHTAPRFRVVEGLGSGRSWNEAVRPSHGRGPGAGVFRGLALRAFAAEGRERPGAPRVSSGEAGYGRLRRKGQRPGVQQPAASRPLPSDGGAPVAARSAEGGGSRSSWQQGEQRSYLTGGRGFFEESRWEATPLAYRAGRAIRQGAAHRRAGACAP
jgi:hypothetical protein